MPRWNKDNKGADWKEAWSRLRRAVESVPGLHVREMHVFGSMQIGLGLESADVDMTVIVPNREPVPVLKLLAKELPRAGFSLRDEVYGARVPILRLHLEGTDFDLSVNNILPVFNTRLIQAYVDLDPRMATLVKEVKLWVKGKGLSGAQSGHLSSYALTLMAIYYAQNKRALPVLQGPHVSPKLEEGCDVAFEVPATWSSRAEAELSFEGFVRFYAVEYRWGRECVSVRNGKRLDLEKYPKLQRLRPRRGISAEEWEISIRIEDPFERSRDLADVLQSGCNNKLRAALLAEHTVQIRRRMKK